MLQSMGSQEVGQDLASEQQKNYDLFVIAAHID